VTGLGSDTRAFIDTDVIPGTEYAYELLVRTVDGDEFRSPRAIASLPALAASLGQNYPNPFNPLTRIDLTLAQRMPVVLEIYDVSGASIARLDLGVKDAGTYLIEWDGTDRSGRSVASGVYLYRIKDMPGALRKMVVLK
jgi:hypothetical protein